ncbi:Pet8p [Ascoidea rubescens DSM 1968]|uniref:Putative mitochondrial carrier protein PET8 n=1 Tax=Ascoidea rubescens DSM 1968 TaxID=1344418 RepID=A0A1D2VB77_9ASCO|nr:putative mitochondrial carrier protein PET8 [Ascoidea rubescens DSM 1968]ODV58861.1 putative mitochondrial carrier protein PET8 [Ascoidea rubescens DSM 1968]
MDSLAFFVSLVSGGCAGTSTDIVFFPIDTVKTRLQAKGGFFKNGGWKGIYKGLGSTVVASAPSASLFFVTYDTLKKELNPIISQNYIKDNKHLSDSVTHMVSASCGEIAACLVRVPAEVIKQRTQASHFASSLESLKYILRNENGEGIIKGLYRGWGTTIMREIPFTVIQFPLYEFLKVQWAIRDNKEKVSPLQGAICGSIAGGIAAATTTPLDVLKTRIMLNEKRIGILKIFRNIITEEGPKAFLSGIGPRTMWISAGGAIFLGVYETVSTILITSTSKFNQ